MAHGVAEPAGAEVDDAAANGVCAFDFMAARRSISFQGAAELLLEQVMI